MALALTLPPRTVLDLLSGMTTIDTVRYRLSIRIVGIQYEDQLHELVQGLFPVEVVHGVYPGFGAHQWTLRTATMQKHVVLTEH